MFPTTDMITVVAMKKNFLTAAGRRFHMGDRSRDGYGKTQSQSGLKLDGHVSVTGQLADKPTRGQSSRGLVNSRTSQLAEMFDL